MRKYQIIPVILLTMSLMSCTDSQQPDRADLLLTGARIFTSNDQAPWAEAVAISDGEIIYVGDVAGAAAYAATRTIDLDGRLVIPGLIDAHAHPGYIEVEQYGAISATTEEQLLAAVSEYAEANPGDGWLRLCCWPIDLYVSGDQGPHKSVLDAVVPDRPVWFVSEWWHSGWLNSAGLDALGVDADSRDPKPGVATFARDADGSPGGWIKEGAAWQFFAEHFPIVDAAHGKTHKDSVVAALEGLSAAGITTLYDAGNFGFEDLVYGFVAGLEREGRLPVRYEGTFQVFTPARRALAVSEMKRYRQQYGGRRLQFNTIKLFMDGINQNRSSATLAPFSDNPDAIGDTLLSADELRDFLLELHEESFDLHIHTMGDLAVRRALDGIEAARQVAGSEFYPRVSISHLGLIDPADVPRIRQLDVIANYTPWWFTTSPNDPMKQSLGETRYNSMYNARTLFEAGITVTFSSDEWWGGDRLPAYLNPYFGMQVGMTRQYPKEWWDGEEAEIRPPASERLSAGQMIAGYTLNAAHQLRMEEQIGSIEVGKLADLVILDDDLFAMDPYAIWRVEPAAVLMEGEVIRGALPE